MSHKLKFTSEANLLDLPQMGLFHGSKPLCPTISHALKGSPDESGVYGVDKVSQTKVS